MVHTAAELVNSNPQSTPDTRTSSRQQYPDRRAVVISWGLTDATEIRVAKALALLGPCTIKQIVEHTALTYATVLRRGLKGLEVKGYAVRGMRVQTRWNLKTPKNVQPIDAYHSDLIRRACSVPLAPGRGGPHGASKRFQNSISEILAYHAQPPHHECALLHAVIAKEAGTTVSHVSDAIRDLRNGGHVMVLPTKNRWKGEGFRYRLPASGVFSPEFVAAHRPRSPAERLIETLRKVAGSSPTCAISSVELARCMGCTPHLVVLARKQAATKHGLKFKHSTDESGRHLTIEYRSFHATRTPEPADDPVSVSSPAPSPKPQAPTRNANYNYDDEDTAIIRNAARTMKPAEMATHLDKKRVALPRPPPPSWLKLAKLPSTWLEVLHNPATRPWFDNVRSYYRSH